MNILSSDLWIVYNFSSPQNRYENFLKRAKPLFKKLIDNLILYDEIVIPTQDFMVLSSFIGILGEKETITLIESGYLKFLRLQDLIAYQVGGGIFPMAIQKPDGSQLPFCGQIGNAIDWALTSRKGLENKKMLYDLTLTSSENVPIRELIDDIKESTYQDIFKAAGLRNHFLFKETDLVKIGKNKKSKVRIYGGLDSEWKGDEIDIILAIASTNLEFKISQVFNCDDYSTTNPIRPILNAKLEQYFGSIKNDFTEFREISEVPDISEGILNKTNSLFALLKLVDSKNGKDFRKWFHSNCKSDPISTGREYCKLLKSEPTISSWPLKTIRFLVTTESVNNFWTLIVKNYCSSFLSPNDPAGGLIHAACGKSG
ncbi:MAG: hypothetical protein JRL30_21185, partial [Deltaproteobacteria bacterium]|nr:hypothetical protein [Deltaproteobacteria bacterium]